MTYKCERSGVIAGKPQDKLLPDPVLGVWERRGKASDYVGIRMARESNGGEGEYGLNCRQTTYAVYMEARECVVVEGDWRV